MAVLYRSARKTGGNTLSGIAAIIRFDGGVVEPGAIERMTAAMAYRGPDGIAHWRDGPAALGHCMLHTTAESLEEVQPLANEDASLILVLDGWLSNWVELRHELLERGARLRTRSDAELVLRAYEAWGEDCPRRIDGEFAFVIWDRRRQTAFVARDHVGLKSIHYHWDGRRMVVASDIAGILALPDIEAVPNLPKMAEYMAFDFIDRRETVWCDIMRPLPAHWMRFDAGGSRTGNYWEPPREVSLVYRRDEDYVAHYRELLADCIRRSSRSHRPVACDVSGGLDSSAVFAMAHQLRRESRLPAPGVTGYTYHWEEAAGTSSDEIDYARAVARHVGAPVSEIHPFLPGLDWFLQRGRDDMDIAGYPNAAMAVTIGEALTRDGCRVIMSGEGGDEWLAGKPFYYSEQIAALDWRSLRQSIAADLAALGPANTAWYLYRFGLGPLLPRPVLNARKWLAQVLRRDIHRNHGWLKPRANALLGERRSAKLKADGAPIRNVARRSMYLTLNDPFALVIWDQQSRQSARLGYEIRTPMYAREFLSFAFSTPEAIRLRGGKRKFLHRRAMAGLLPQVVLERETKADFNLAFDRNLDQIAQILSGFDLGHAHDLLDLRGVNMLLDAYRSEPSRFYRMWAIWGIFEIIDICGLSRVAKP